MIWFVLIFISLISFATWYFFGKDLDSKNPYPLFEPPDSISPAVIRFIDKMSFDPKIFTIYLISLSSKGYIGIYQSEEPVGTKGYWYSIKMLKEIEDETDLPEDEIIFLKKLFQDSSGKIAMRSSESHSIHKTLQDMEDLFKNEFKERYLNTNKGLFLMIFAISFVMVICCHVYMDLPLLIYIPIFIGMSVFTFFLWAFVRGYGPYLTGELKFSISIIPFAIFHFVVLLVVAIPFLYFITVDVPPDFIIGLAGIVMVLFITYKSLMTRTKEGRAIQNKIEGFKMYLNATEEERIKLHDQFDIPEVHNKDIYTKYFPYSVAFDNDTEWTERLTYFLKVAEEEGDLFGKMGYNPDNARRKEVTELILKKRSADGVS